MQQLDGQISMFEVVGDYATPTIGRDGLYDGLVAWIAVAKPWSRGIGDVGPLWMVQCMARKVRFKRLGNSLFYDTIDGGDVMGGSSVHRVVFARKPTDDDIRRAAIEGMPEYLRQRIGPKTDVVVADRKEKSREEGDE